jgi:hypothetical protein
MHLEMYRIRIIEAKEKNIYIQTHIGLAAVISATTNKQIKRSHHQMRST